MPPPGARTHALEPAQAKQIVLERLEELALIAQERKSALIGWLGQAAIGAIIMNPKSAGTYSYYSSEHHAAAGSTVELGRVGTLGKNNLAQFADAAQAEEAIAAARAAFKTWRRSTPQQRFDVLDAVGKSKPASFKGGQYIKSVALSSSMSPGVRIASAEFSKF